MLLLYQALALRVSVACQHLHRWMTHTHSLIKGVSHIEIIKLYAMPHGLNTSLPTIHGLKRPGGVAGAPAIARAGRSRPASPISRRLLEIDRIRLIR